MTMTTIEKRTYQPLAPVGSAGGLKGLLETQRAGIAEMLPRHVSPERLFKTMLVAANRVPQLLNCTQASIIETIFRAAELGLDLSGTLGEAYPVPFNNKVKDSSGREQWVTQCQLIIGYRGFAKLARQTGEIKRIDADVVCVNDTFVMRKGSDARCEFTPNLTGHRGEPVGAYAYVLFKDGGEQFDFMPVSDIENVRLRSKSGSVQKDSQYAKKGDPIGAWKTDWGEMAKKTVFRRVAKWLPLSTEKFVRAMELDNGDLDAARVLEASTAGGRATDRLNGRITERPVSEGHTFVPDDDAQARIAAQDEHVTEAAADPSQHGNDAPAEPDVSGADTGEPPAVAEDPAATWPDTLAEIQLIAAAKGWNDAAAGKRVGDYLVKRGCKGKPERLTAAQRRELLDGLDAEPAMPGE